MKPGINKGLVERTNCKGYWTPKDVNKIQELSVVWSLETLFAKVV